MPIVYFLSGVVVMCFVFILIFFFIPSRKIMKGSDEHWNNLEQYWKDNNVYKKRMAEALENIYDGVRIR